MMLYTSFLFVVIDLLMISQANALEMHRLCFDLIALLFSDGLAE